MCALMNIQKKLGEEAWEGNDQEVKAGTKHPSLWTKNSLCSHKPSSDFRFLCFFNFIVQDIFNRLHTINFLATINFLHPGDYTQVKINGRNKCLNYIQMFLDMLLLSTFIFYQEKLQKHLKRILSPRVLVNSIISVKGNAHQNYKTNLCKNKLKSIPKKSLLLNLKLTCLCSELNISVKSYKAC